MEAVTVLIEENPDDFPVVKAAVEGIQPGDFLAHRLGYAAGAAAGRHVDVVGQQPQHTLLAEAAQERADGVRVGLRFLGPLRGRAILEEEQRADHLIALLGLIGEAELSVRKLCGRFHAAPLTRHAIEGLMEHTRRTLSRRPREHDVRQGSDVSETVDFMPHRRQEAVAMYGRPLGITER
jgi:hypothetical protein